MIDITSDLKELNISYDKINVVRQGENSDTFLITTSKKKLIAKKFKNLNFQTFIIFINLINFSSIQFTIS